MEGILSWIRVIKIAAPAIAATLATSAIAGTIVIRSSGPSAKLFPAGKSLSDGQKLTLRAGDTLVLLDGKGTRTLTGAGSFDIGASAARGAAPSTFAALIGSAGTRQVRTGAVRGTGSAAPRVNNLWYVDTSKSGAVCLRDTSRATLWRGNIDAPVTLTLTRASDGKAVPLSFAAGQAVKSWPVADLPITAGADYRVSGPGLVKPSAIRIVQAAPASDDADAVAADLIRKDCSGQLDVLVEAGQSVANTG